MLRFVYFAFFLFSPFLILGLINRVKAVWVGREGAPLLQPLFEYIKLLRKGQVISSTTSFVFRLAPTVNIAAVIFAALILPLPGQRAFIRFDGDFVVFAYALALAKFFLIIAALDTGSSFEGMGAAREATFSTIVEPAFFVLMGSLALITGRTSFDAIFTVLNYSSNFTILVKMLCWVSLAVMLLTEGARVPVDDPNTHLELTMIHEVMILDYSGPDLAFMIHAAGLKMALIGTLLANLIIPPGFNSEITFLIYLAVLFVIAVGVGAVESLTARLRMSHVPQFILLMTALSLTAFAVIIFFVRGGF